MKGTATGLNDRMIERLDPTALHFKGVEVEGFKVIRQFAKTFRHHNVITGMNGVGKTTLLHLLAGIAGNDAATHLIADEKIGRIKVTLAAGNEEYTFEAKDRLDRDSLDSFKASLPDGKRANYALSEYYYERFQYGCCDFATFEQLLREFHDRSGHHPQVFVQPGRSVKMDPGSGVKQAMKLIFLSSFSAGPLILDHPEISMDHRNKVLLSMMIQDSRKQTISVTHSEEFARSIENKIEMTV